MPKAPPPARPKFSVKLALRVLAWSGVIAGMAWGGRKVESFLTHDSRFELECEPHASACAGLEIQGASYTNRARIRSVFAQDFGRSIAAAPIAERRRRLLAVDWVNSATVSRVWPNRLLIRVGERKPAAFAKLPVGTGRYRMALMDADGVLLPIPPRSRFRLPVLSGVSEDQLESERRVRVKAMQHLLDDLGPDSKMISEVNASNTLDLRLIAEVDGEAVELWMGDQHYRTRLQNFLKHFGQMRKSSGSATVFDLRLDDRISAR